jgi:hypothetical protein
MANGTVRPAGGSFTVEMSGNRAFTTLSYDGRLVKEFGDGMDQPFHNPEWLVTQLLVHRGGTD